LWIGREVAKVSRGMNRKSQGIAEQVTSRPRVGAEKHNVTVLGSESNETFTPRAEAQTKQRIGRFNASTLGPGLGTSDSGKRPAEKSVLGFVSLGIPGTNHKGTGADHASSVVVCVTESVLRTYRRL
jgi:hypothetical protein